MIFSFKNNKENDLTVFMNPSTDQFVLLPNSTIKIYSVLKNEDDEFEFYCCSDGIVIWMPRGSTGKFFIDEKRMDTLYEYFDW